MVCLKTSLECSIFLIFSEIQNLVIYSIFARVHIGLLHCSFKIQISPLIQKSIFLLIICFDAMTLISKHFSLVDRLARLNHIDVYVRLRDRAVQRVWFSWRFVCILWGNLPFRRGLIYSHSLKDKKENSFDYFGQITLSIYQSTHSPLLEKQFLLIDTKFSLEPTIWSLLQTIFILCLVYYFWNKNFMPDYVPLK